MKGIVYAAVNKINGKAYVGKSYKDLCSRQIDHYHCIKRFPNRPFYRALAKYGIEGFDWEILGTYNQGILEAEEISWINEFDSYSKGYNATIGGDGRPYLNICKQELIKVFKKLKTVKYTAEHFNCDCESIRVRLRQYFPEYLEIIKEQQIKHRNANLQFKEKKISCVIKDKEYIFNSISEAARFCMEEGLSRAKHRETVRKCITKVLTGTRHKFLGINWKYVAE